MKGQCLCGAITVTAPDHTRVSVCHCGLCRRWGGGPLFAVHVGEGVAFEGEEQPGAFQSSDWAERGFCRRCGTHLYYKLLPTNEYLLTAGLFPDAPFQLEEQIFVDRKPGYYDFANRTEQLTEAEVFAKYMPG